MNQKWSRESLKNVQVAVWMIGLGVLFLLDAFWPGILILIGLSLLIQSLMPEEQEQPAPELNEDIKPDVPDQPEEKTSPDENISPHKGTPDLIPPPLEPLQVAASGLPTECPACGGPVAENAQAVKSVGEGVVLCPFCDARIMME
ncbi:MAG: hypothetical protein RBT34_05015 [Anaerolineaceae bacterium]|jgi:hypothetical protein|nr:hypothetical protein [Anaerolineaceae bacterium]